ncbi:MAG: DUF4340 domain-containing protein, partial [Planctomycetales bacterium]|nr:DUF4340 domain-containing protein [Planctomycetales bacterium]
MSEIQKTMAFVGAGALALLAGFGLRPNEATQDVQELVGTTINEFDPSDPTSLRIVKFDGERGESVDFEVARRNGFWTIPSKQGYPADAIEHMADAATCLANRDILRVQSELAQDHVEYGVVDPLSSGLDSTSEGVGTRVTMTNAKDETLVDMIIGAKVKDAEEQYYVRNSNQDVVYVVNLDPSKLTTSFEDWIEDDLLDINTFDMRKIFINDYSAQLGMVLGPQGIQTQVNWERRGQYAFDYDADDAKWLPGELKKFDESTLQMVDFQPDEGEGVNEDSLREFRNALDDLLIVDVEKKPKGLSADLKAGDDFLGKDNEETLQSLIDRGFAPVPLTRGGSLEILSSEGEVVCTMRNGVEYVLRFGKLRAGGDAEVSEGQEVDKTDLPASELKRYLFVMARLNEDSIEKPELEAVPPLPEGVSAEEETAGDATPDDAGTEAAVDQADDEAAEEE